MQIIHAISTGYSQTTLPGEPFPTTTPINLCLPLVEKVWKTHRSRIYSAFLNCKQPSTARQFPHTHNPPLNSLIFNTFFDKRQQKRGIGLYIYRIDLPPETAFSAPKTKPDRRTTSSSPYDLCKPLLYGHISHFVSAVSASSRPNSLSGIVLRCTEGSASVRSRRVCSAHGSLPDWISFDGGERLFHFSPTKGGMGRHVLRVRGLATPETDI